MIYVSDNISYCWIWWHIIYHINKIAGEGKALFRHGTSFTYSLYSRYTGERFRRLFIRSWFIILSGIPHLLFIGAKLKFYLFTIFFLIFFNWPIVRLILFNDLHFIYLYCYLLSLFFRFLISCAVWNAPVAQWSDLQTLARLPLRIEAWIRIRRCTTHSSSGSNVV